MAQADSTILILGESGVGKDLIARMIHDASPRNESGEFVKIECGAIPEQLLESELFGYEPGAFTGARKEGKVGYLEIANKGTFFLDEIGDLPKRLQVKLLGTIQDQQIRRVGGTEQTKIDVRIIAATNRDLEQMMLAGEFREDLYYRISVIPIIIPPLRERRDDIPFLLAHYLHHFNTKYDKDVSISNEVLDILSEYDWHGNVRELCNLVERVVLSAQKTLVTISALPEKYKRENVNVDVNVKEFSFSSLKDEVQRYELQLVKGVLSQDSSLEEAASRLKISISSLIRRKRRIDNQK